MKTTITFCTLAVLFLLQESKGHLFEPNQCCDIVNVTEVTDFRESVYSFPKYRAVANTSNVAKCTTGYQCVACNVKDYSVQALVSHCAECGDAPGMGGVCIPCLLGDYCPEGTVNEDAHSMTNLCPDGQICTPSGLGLQVGEEAHLSEAGTALTFYTRYDTEVCPEGSLCPAGTFELENAINCQTSIMAYFTQQLTKAVREDEPSGYYCKPGSSGFESLFQRKQMLQECEKGFYCPNASHTQVCPSGSFCKALIDEPRECPGLNTCQGEGNSKPEPTILRILYMVAIYLVLMMVGGYSNHRMKRRFAAEKKKTKPTLSFKGKHAFVHQVMYSMGVELHTKADVFADAAQPLSFKFEDLTLVVNEVKLLSGLNGYFQHSRLIAIMGPSGSGKSTLLNTLCGRAPRKAVRTGTLLVNGRGGKRVMNNIQGLLGYVPQKDLIFQDMTIYENLFYSANLRLPREYSPERRLQLVNGVLGDVMGLAHLKNSVVGMEDKGGLDIGKRRRVNIGMELVADPTALFLDEPTTGLTPTDSLQIVQSLHMFAHASRTVVACIQHPRYLTMMLFHDVLLLYRGGSTVFFGSADQCEQYFESLNYFTPKIENPADFFLDVISGTVDTGTEGADSDLPTVWRERVEAVHPQDGVRGYLRKRRTQAEMVVDTLAAAKQFSATGLASKWKKSASSQQDGTARRASLSRRDSMSRSNLGRDRSHYNNPLCHLAVEKIDRGFSQLAHGNPEVPRDQLRSYFVEMGCEEDKVDGLLEAIDLDGDGMISQTEFLNLFATQLRETDKEDTAASKLKSASMIERENENGEPEKIRKRDTSLARQYYWIAQRSVMRKSRRWTELMRTLTTLVMSGFAVGLLLSSDSQPYSPDDPTLPLVLAVLVTVVAVVNAISSTNVFGNTKELTIRERSSGISTLAFFIANTSVDLLDNVWQPLFQLGIAYNWIIPMSRFFDMYWSLILVSFAASGVGIFVSVILNSRGKIMMVTTLSVMVCGIFINGTIGVHMNSVKDDGFQYLWSCSYARWAQELLFVNELKASASQPYQDLLIQDTILYYGFFPRYVETEEWREGKSQEEMNKEIVDYLASFQTRCIVALVAIGFVLRAVSFFFMQFLREIAEFSRYFNLIIKVWLTKRVYPWFTKRYDAMTTIFGCYEPAVLPEDDQANPDEVTVEVDNAPTPPMLRSA